MKKFLLVILAAAAFLVGYASSAEAWPVYGRSELYGYFKNIYDNSGNDVWDGGIPTSVNSSDEFINFVKAKLSNGPNTRNGVGAAFIIQTMIGSARNLPPTAAQISEWEARVRFAEQRGWVQWNRTINYQLNSTYQGMGTGSNPVDNAFFDQGHSASDTAIVFTNGSGIVYAIRHVCANPIGTVSPLVDPPEFTVNGNSYVTDNTVLPGQTVTFRHQLTNQGPDTAPDTRWVVRHNGNQIASGGPFYLGPSATVNTNNFTVPNNALPGTRYCQYISYTPKDEYGGGGQSGEICATVIADFNLRPTVTASATAAQQNEVITFTYTVFNDGPTPSTTTDCRVVGNVRAPGYTPLPAEDANRQSDPGYSPTSTNCPRNFFIGATGTEVAVETINTNNVTPGSRICRSLVINPRDENGGHRVSAETCVVIAKTPYVHFQGNDVWAGGSFPEVNAACSAASKITTSAHTLNDGSVAGGAVEYAAFALGKISNFGSASRSLVNPAAAAGKMLTFTNVNNNNLGFFAAAQHCINSYVSTYSGTPITSLGSPVDVNRGSGTWQLNGPVTFRGTVPNGAMQVYLVNGDVTIDNNIRYSNSYANAGEIPSLVIIATGDVLVRSNVDDIAGLYVARDTFNTCSDAPTGNLSISDCNKQLTVNGSVITGNLRLMRTFGADGANDDDRKRPAEVFNFNAEMYIRSALNGNNANTLRTVDEKDLPPRY